MITIITIIGLVFFGKIYKKTMFFSYETIIFSYEKKGTFRLSMFDQRRVNLLGKKRRTSHVHAEVLPGAPAKACDFGDR
jgi:hypothetical protein